MVKIEDLKVGHVLLHEKSGIYWIILALVDGSNINMLPGIPLLLPVDRHPNVPYVVIAIFNVEARCDNDLPYDLPINSDFLSQYNKVNIDPVLHYDDMAFN